MSDTRLISVSLLEAALQQADAGSHEARVRIFQWIFSYSSVSSEFEEPSAEAVLLLRSATILYTCSETENSKDLSQSIEDLATRIGVLAMRQTTEVDPSVMSISHLTLILGITGKQKDYETLKVSKKAAHLPHSVNPYFRVETPVRLCSVLANETPSKSSIFCGTRETITTSI